MARRAKHHPAASEFISLNRGPTTADARARLAERDARVAADTRTEVQKYLGDPPPGRSALAQVSGGVSHAVPEMAPGTETRVTVQGARVDLWRKV